MTTRTRAELIWQQADDTMQRLEDGSLIVLRHWRGRLLNGAAARDEQARDQPAEEWVRGRLVRRRYICRADEQADGSVRLSTQGPHIGGRRHRTFHPLRDADRWAAENGRPDLVTGHESPISAALGAGSRWARRRFWLDLEETSR